MRTTDKFVGWIAFYAGKKLEIKKEECTYLWNAKQRAITVFKVPKSKVGMLAVEPAYEEVEA